MVIDDSIVLQYLSGENAGNISSHWIFHNIEKGKFIFETPDNAKRDEVNKIFLSIKRTLLEFTPINKDIYSVLYPEWKSIISNANILLIVGCPKPYDAMVREYAEKEYIIFDLMRFSDYSEEGYDIDMLIRKLVTHETSHLCLHMKYPVPTSDDFPEQLKYIVFDEGFAHLLSYKDNIQKFHFSTVINEHYNQSLMRLKEAMKEKDHDKQMILLQQSNSGSYWSKFAAISGKLFLAIHLKDIENLYNDGINNFITSIGL